MFTKSISATLNGINGVKIIVETDVARGIPAIDIVGMAETSVKEARDRVRAAIRNAGFEFPVKRITINLAPANIKKEGSGFDLPVAIGIMAAAGYIQPETYEDYAFIGELSLDGKLRGISGILPMVIALAKEGIKKVVVAPENAGEVCLVNGIEPVPAAALADVIAHLRSERLITCPAIPEMKPESLAVLDFADVQGQMAGKRALEIAAAGGHNVILTGPPGTGKTMLAKRITGILPAMTDAEALEVTKIYSVAGLMKGYNGLVQARPFRSPHHTTSDAAMIGGGRIPRPGEVTLSHNGVLFLDEFPEFSKNVVEAMRQPLEDSEVTIARVGGTLTYPASFMLLAAMNPCPCGYRGDNEIACRCSENDLLRYRRRLSGPLLDRIDIAVEVPRLKYSEFVSDGCNEKSGTIRERVAAARHIQRQRFGDCGISCNSQMQHNLIKRYCQMTDGAAALLKHAYDRLHLSARAYDRIIKTARTIADLENVAKLREEHIAEAIQLRPKQYTE